MNQRYLIFLYCFILLGYLLAMQIDVMDVDAAQYATISMEMVQSGSYLEVYDRGVDYLDKPPLLFWLSALSMKLFGLNNFAYKLPSVLASLLAVFSIYKTTRLFYSQKAANIAGLITASSVAIIFTTNDVRTDNLLIGFSSMAIWQMANFIRNNKTSSAVLAGFAIGCAMLAKGPFGLIYPVAVIGFHMLLSGNLKSLFRWRWFTMLPVIGIMLLPMSIGLYNQWDLHPEKVHVLAGKVRTGVSGLNFFFWEQSFGRVTGENEWSNNPDPLFLVHNFWWAFLPWTVLHLIAFFAVPIYWVRCRFSKEQVKEGIGWGGYFIATVALSQSKFQLPHYIFVAIPPAALLVAGFIDRVRVREVWIKVFNGIQNVISLLLILVVLLATQLMFGIAWWQWVIYGVIFILLVLWNRKVKDELKFVFTSCLSMLLVGLVMHTSLYPSLFEYQGSSNMGKYVKEKGIAKQVVFYNNFGRAQDFYAQTIIPYCSDMDTLKKEVEYNDSLWVYINKKDYHVLTEHNLAPKLEKAFPSFSVQFGFANKDFRNPETRANALDTIYLARVK